MGPTELHAKHILRLVSLQQGPFTLLALWRGVRGGGGGGDGGRLWDVKGEGCGSVSIKGFEGELTESKRVGQLVNPKPGWLHINIIIHVYVACLASLTVPKKTTTPS